MFLETRVLEFLSKKEATVGEISEEIQVSREKVESVLNRLRSSGLLIEG